MSKLMRGGGSTVIMGRSPITYFEGRCVGGSTVINGGMCWRTPERVLEEWRDDFNLPEMTHDILDPIFEHVEHTINARHQDPGSEGECNHAFRRGAEALGWKLNQNKRNQIHCVGSNDCITGCPSGGKQSTLYSWLPRFFQRGGRLYTKMKVNRVETNGRQATGVSGLLLDPYKQRTFTVQASAVVLACGAVQTPLLLQRNGLAKDCGRVGRHFTIHPNVKVAALFDEDIDSMRGTHQAWQCTEFADEGILLAPGAVPLAFLSAVMDEFGTKL